jgi:hypothetical protein
MTPSKFEPSTRFEAKIASVAPCAGSNEGCSVRPIKYAEPDVMIDFIPRPIVSDHYYSLNGPVEIDPTPRLGVE